jgi:outer membrane protein TolC
MSLRPLQCLRVSMACALMCLTPSLVRGQMPAAAAPAPVQADRASPPDWLASVRGTPWADPIAVQQALQARPAWRMALQGREAEHAQSEVTGLGGNEWHADLSAGTRWHDDPLQRRSREWELGVQRPWRSGHKARVAGEQAQAQLAQADLALVQHWQGLALALVDDVADWVNLLAQSQAWGLQQDAMDQLAQAARKRVQLGEGAELDSRQADAAWAQARLQGALAQQRLRNTQALLQQRWPQWPWSPDQTLAADGDACSPARTAATWSQGLQDKALLWQWAQAALQQARSQAQADAAQTSPDPTIGVKGGQAGNGAERYVGLTFSLPWGGPARDAQARASARRLAMAEQGIDQAQEAVQALAITEVGNWQAACTQWQLERQAHVVQTNLAQALARGHDLGEGSLQAVLQAQAVAHDMHLRAEQARAQAWRGWSRMLVLNGELWAR